MHKSATKCNETICKWCKNKHGASKIIDTLETYQLPRVLAFNEIHQEDLIKDRLLQLEEAWCQAALRAARYQ
jgi:hypothetical protein